MSRVTRTFCGLSLWPSPSFPELFGIPVHLFAAYAGLAFGLLALVEAWRTLGVLGVSGWPRSLAVVTLGANTEFWLSVTLGLEGDSSTSF